MCFLRRVRAQELLHASYPITQSSIHGPSQSASALRLISASSWRTQCSALERTLADVAVGCGERTPPAT
eukprot:12322766-Heterocapsa_arctica.AAC.1